MKIRSIPVFLLSPVLLLAGCAGDGSEMPEFTGLPDAGTSLEQPQVVSTGDGNVVFVWTARGDDGVDVFVSRSENEEFQPAVRLNPAAGSVNRLPIDEMRPAIAAVDGRLAIAWTDMEFDIQVAVSRDDGRTFDPPIRLNRDEGDALQEFPALAFDPTGRLHAVWLDPRVAGPGLEEPSDVYYTTIDEDGMLGPEINLTADQENSVCGCCLPSLDAQANGSLTVTFRNTTPAGYRDPFRITGQDGAFGSPEPVSPPIWQIDACPVAGPIGVGDRTLWLDGSTGTRRLLSASSAESQPEVVFEDSDTDLLLLPPRQVSGLPASSSPLVLVPMADNSRLIVPDGDSWRTVADDLPFWVTSAVVHNGRLLLVGTSDGFQYESRPWG